MQMTYQPQTFQLVNLTPHAVVFRIGGEWRELPPSGTVARCVTARGQVGAVAVDGLAIPINRLGFGRLEGLPPAATGTAYIVSTLAGQAAKALGREDVFIIDEAVRDAAGQIIGCAALARP